MKCQASARMEGERRALATMIRLLCAVSIWRTAMTRILPLGGTSAWWVTLLCLVPGVFAAAVMRMVMRLTRSATVTEGLRACLGRGGAYLLCGALAVPLLVEAAADVTALITLFTEGAGTRGTQITLALLTGGALIFSLHRDGLARGAYFLRGLLVAGAMVLGGFLLARSKADHLFPIWGVGRTALTPAIGAGWSLAWPVSLLLTIEPACQQGRLRGAVLPVFAPVGALLIITLAIPHELLIRQSALAQLMLLPAMYLPNALRLLWLCLLMLAFFLVIGASVQLASAQVASVLPRVPGWLSGALLAVLVLLQAGEPSVLWRSLAFLEPWLLLPLEALAMVCLPIAFIRRNQR